MNPPFTNPPHQFTHAGVRYEIRSAPFADGIHYAVFADGTRLTQDSVMSFEKNDDIATLSGQTALELVCKEIEKSIRDGTFAAILAG